MNTERVVVAVACVVLAIGAGSFAVSPAVSTQEVVDFDDTVKIGLTIEQRQTLAERDRFVPRAQVTYSQYTYVVGYRGIGLAAADVDDPLMRQRFGYPQTIYVETAPSDVELDAENFVSGDQTGEWVHADEAFFVVDTGARIPGSAATVPFADRSDAVAFADRYDGRVLEWADRSAFDAPEDGGELARDRIDRQNADADAAAAEAREALDREESVVVGEDVETLQAALDRAEPNTTIRLPPGTYQGPVTVDRPVTIRGEDARIVGDGEGSVVTIRDARAAIVGVSISGVGETHRPEDVTPEDWDETIEAAYGHADAGITIVEGDRVFVSEVEIDTPASGIAVRDSQGTVVDDVTIQGADTWQEGFMGVVTIRSPAVIQNSTVADGRDGVYTHRSHGVVVRDSEFDGGRFGIHLMYTSDALLEGNCLYGQGSSGIVVMTSPSGTAITENVLVDASQGILTSGSDAYVGENLVVGSQQGISTGARNSLYVDNAVVGNDVGVGASSIIPTSRVVDNDVVDNHQHVRVGSGPLRVWSHGDRGNYWSGAADLDRPFAPSGPIDSRLHRTTTAETLAASPVAHTLRALRTEAPGMRTAQVVDAAPRSTPSNPERVETGRALLDDYETNRDDYETNRDDYETVACPTDATDDRHNP